MNRRDIMKYNMIIPVVYRDFSFLGKTIEYVFRNLVPETLYIITDIRFRHFLPKEVLYNKRCAVIDENELLVGIWPQATCIYLRALARQPPKLLLARVLSLG